eukprot:CAMPEP_0202879002 /NCGR_PEP_ID=MMETSP1391-20130828/33025_1 /ASSEMBLY_ACC=CAM_ASM_000867 /TAXON_ID=1034604 /ORGANISM="Chlamydomonas leiostraca, Strain SAG 11-49" /LENGTH=389 /DNA_ID=CAMNT_0049561301 /DNA_START=152 /DNA_END=1318 /DNA_ORIENTATION=+
MSRPVRSSGSASSSGSSSHNEDNADTKRNGGGEPGRLTAKATTQHVTPLHGHGAQVAHVPALNLAAAAGTAIASGGHHAEQGFISHTGASTSAANALFNQELRKLDESLQASDDPRVQSTSRKHTGNSSFKLAAPAASGATANNPTPRLGSQMDAAAAANAAASAVPNAGTAAAPCRPSSLRVSERSQQPGIPSPGLGSGGASSSNLAGARSSQSGGNSPSVPVSRSHGALEMLTLPTDLASPSMLSSGSSRGALTPTPLATGKRGRPSFSQDPAASGGMLPVGQKAVKQGAGVAAAQPELAHQVTPRRGSLDAPRATAGPAPVGTGRERRASAVDFSGLIGPTSMSFTAGTAPSGKARRASVDLSAMSSLYSNLLGPSPTMNAATLVG